MLEVFSSSNWDENFFTEFYLLKNDLHQEIPFYLSENIDDYKKFFADVSPFKETYQWEAFLIKKDGKSVAKAVIAWKQNSSKGNVGFIDWINDFEVAEKLWSEIESFAKTQGIEHLKAPMDFNFFVSFRVRLKTTNPPIFGEPIYPSYYQSFFEKLGMNVCGEWDVYQVKVMKAIMSFWKQRRQVGTKKIEAYQTVKLRSLRIDDWDNELKILHKLFLQAYSVMADFEPVTFDQFKVLFDKFRYIASPRFCFIAEYQGQPVGYSINYPDPQRILKSIHGKELNFWQKALTLLRLKLNHSDFIIAHVGRIPGPNGEDIKGFQAKVSKKLYFNAFFMKRIFLVQRSDALSRRAWGEGNVETYAQYVLYDKNLK